MSVTWEIFGDNDDLRKLNNRYRMNKIIKRKSDYLYKKMRLLSKKRRL